MPTQITLIRHGETDWNVQGRWQGQAHVPLNEEGKRQAAILADYLYNSGDAANVTAIYASDLWRTMQTAQYIAERLGKPISLEPRLREVDMGEWQGLTGDEVRAWDGDRYAAMLTDPLHARRPSGESNAEVGARALEAVEEIAARHPNEHILVVTHGGTIVNLLRMINLWEDNKTHIGNTSQSRLLHHADQPVRWTLDMLGSVAHLADSDNVPLPEEENSAPEIEQPNG